ADEPAHDVTSAGALSRPNQGAAAIFGFVSLRRPPLGTWNWHRPRPPSAAAAMACAHRISTAGLPRRAIHRPSADERPATGWIRPCPYDPSVHPGRTTTRPRKRRNDPMVPGVRPKFLVGKNAHIFQSVSAPAKGDCAREKRDLAPLPTGKSGRDGEPVKRYVSANEADRAVAPRAFLLRRPCKHCLAFRR